MKLPEIRVIGTTPVPAPARAPAAPAPAGVPSTTAAPQAVPGAVDRDKVPANVQTLAAPDFDHAITPDLLQAMARGLPGVALGDQTGNQFQLGINYRGFVSSPVLGTPQGLAVYQNGVRVNEVFGDVVNWDFIPDKAINRMTLVPSNPVYGLNALGGALSLEMKNGFTYQGVEGELNGGLVWPDRHLRAGRRPKWQLVRLYHRRCGQRRGLARGFAFAPAPRLRRPRHPRRQSD